MDIKLLALAGIMTATFGLTACDSNKENAVDDLQDAQEEEAFQQVDRARSPEVGTETQTGNRYVSFDQKGPIH